MTEKILMIYGAGGAGREFASNFDGQVLGFIDDTKMPGEIIDSLPVWGGFDYLKTYYGDLAFCIVGNPKVKKELIGKLKSKCPGVGFPTVFTPHNVIAKGIKWGEGSIVAHPYNIICPGVCVGEFVWINAKNSIGHNVKIGNYTTLYSGIFLGGGSSVGEFCVIGTGAIVNPGVKVGDNVILGAGAVVVNDIKEPGVYVGTPARRIK